jgi:hypothetical protein
VCFSPHNLRHNLKKIFRKFFLLSLIISHMCSNLRALCSVLLTKYHSGDQVKKAEMGRTCGTYGEEKRCIQGFSGET